MEILSEGLKVTVIGMGVVFLALFLLSVILRFFELFFYKEETEVKTPLPEIKEGERLKGREGEDIEEVVLAISAVMASILDDNEYICNIRQVN